MDVKTGTGWEFKSIRSTKVCLHLTGHWNKTPQPGDLEPWHPGPHFSGEQRSKDQVSEGAGHISVSSNSQNSLCISTPLCGVKLLPSIRTPVFRIKTQHNGFLKVLCLDTAAHSLVVGFRASAHGLFWEYSSSQHRAQTESEFSAENMAHVFSQWSLVPTATGRNAAPCFISNKFPGYCLSVYCRREAVHTSAQRRILLIKHSPSENQAAC